MRVHSPTLELLVCPLRIASVIICAIIAFRVNLAMAEPVISKVQLLAAPHIGAGKWSCTLYLRQSAFAYAGHFLNSYSHNHNLIATHCAINHPDLSSNMRTSLAQTVPSLSSLACCMLEKQSTFWRGGSIAWGMNSLRWNINLRTLCFPISTAELLNTDLLVSSHPNNNLISSRQHWAQLEEEGGGCSKSDFDAPCLHLQHDRTQFGFIV